MEMGISSSINNLTYGTKTWDIVISLKESLFTQKETLICMLNSYCNVNLGGVLIVNNLSNIRNRGERFL